MNDVNEAIALDPYSAVSYIYRGEIYTEYDLLSNAISDFTRAIQIEPDNANAYLQRGKVYAQQGQYNLAMEDFTSAVSLDNEFRDAYYERFAARFDNWEREYDYIDSTFWTETMRAESDREFSLMDADSERFQALDSNFQILLRTMRGEQANVLDARYNAVFGILTPTYTPTATPWQSATPSLTARPRATRWPTYTPVSIQYAQLGDNSGQILVGRMQTWNYDGQVGEVLTLMAYAAWDTALSLRLNSEELVFNDDYYGMNARIQYTLPSDGTYEIVVSGYYERDGGTYTLRVESSIYSTATPAVTVTAQSPTEMPDAIITAMAGLVRPDKIFTPTPETEEQLPTTPIMHNSDWMPVERDFNSIPFILVPAGCFMMGSEGGQDNEQPMHEQCFDVPFWIGKTEVTQADFERLGGMKANSNGYTGNANPVENITWFESQSFCEGLGGSLPTEAEWEYAARGPESFVYPWGNNYDATLVIGRDDPTYGFPNGSRVGTAPVGSRTAGASWVGALDMAGNVWEWTLSGFEPYPYVTGDGRNDTQDSIGDRVLRGGSFGDVNNDLRSAYRFNWFNDYYFSIGFRCVVSEEVSDDGNSDR